MKQKRGLRLFITACIPGCGQMYQGYMKRGLSLLLALCAIFLLAVVLSLEELTIFFIPLWAFSFFDTYNIRARADGQQPTPDDSFLFGLNDMDTRKLAALCGKRHSLLGWGLVILGGYALFDTFVGRILRVICQQLDSWWLYDLVMQDVPRLVVTAGIIALGVWFIRGPKHPPAEDIPAFVPPAPETTCEQNREEDRHGEE